MASDGKWYPPESLPSVQPTVGREPSERYAGFWLRFWAWLLAAVIISTSPGCRGRPCGW